LKESDCFYHALSTRDSKVNGVLLKINYSGDTLWQRTYVRDSLEEVYLSGVARSADGGFLLTGRFEYYDARDGYVS